MAQGLTAPSAGAPSATSVQVAQGRLAVLAGPGAVNRIAVTVHNQAYRVTDVVPLVVGTGCQLVSQTEASCPANGIASVFFQLGDGDDTAEFSVPVKTEGGGDAGDDSVWGGSADDTIYGGTGTDKLHGGDGADYLYGGAGSDYLYGENGGDHLDGGDWGDFLYGGTGADTLDESLWSGGNKLDGGPDDDTIIGSGQGMRDMVIYSDRTDPVGVNLSGTAYADAVNLPAGSGGELDDSGNLAEQDAISGVQDAWTGSGDDILIGFTGPDDVAPLLNSGAGDDLCDPNGDDGVKLETCVH